MKAAPGLFTHLFSYEGENEPGDISTGLCGWAQDKVSQEVKSTGTTMEPWNHRHTKQAAAAAQGQGPETHPTFHTLEQLEM